MYTPCKKHCPGATTSRDPTDPTHSGGSHYGSNMRRTGIPGLSKAVGELGLQTGPDLKVDFAVSSVGSLNDNFVASMHAAARGVSRLRSTGDPIPPKLHERFSIYFPLHDTVAQSKGGTAVSSSKVPA